MGFQTCTAILALIFGALAWASPEQTTSLEQQLASIGVQRESVQKQVASVRSTSFRPVVVSSAVRPITISSPAPIVKSIAALEPISPSPALPQLDCSPMAGEQADDLINAAASEQALSPALLRSVIKHESAFRPCALSIVGAQGLMQLMPATAEQFGVTDPFDPRQNIGGGAAFLRQLLNRYGGDLKLALGAYNAGIGRVEAIGGIPDIGETQHYVSSILEDLGMTGGDEAAEEQPIAEPVTPKKEDFRQITLQLSLDPKQATKSSVQLAVGN
ncbi:MAG: lytic transglycosylase domain-containing protein [Bryobacteraceae bacterium]